MKCESGNVLFTLLFVEVLWQSCGSLEIICPGNDAIRSSITFENTLNLH